MMTRLWAWMLFIELLAMGTGNSAFVQATGPNAGHFSFSIADGGSVSPGVSIATVPPYEVISTQRGTPSAASYSAIGYSNDLTETVDLPRFAPLLSSHSNPLERGLFSGRPLLIRGQASGDSYWSTVQTTPYYVAQASEISAADTAPRLDASVGTSTTDVAPPSDALTLTPSTGTTAPPMPTDSNPNFFEEPVQTMKRFWEGTSASYTFIPKSGGDEGLGLNDFEFRMQFNFPCKCLPHAGQDGVSGYWYVAPNFGLQLWSMPGWPYYEMPSQTFDASLAFGCQPQFTKDFGADLCIEAGVASSFQKVNCDSFFLRGRGLGTLRINDQITAIGGVIYYDRNRYKLLPSGGIKWVPNEKNEWLLVFPNPKLSRYIANLNETKWWAYLQGDIGGGRWLIKDEGRTVNIDYNDYRIGIGTSFTCPSGFNGFVEVGGAFGRELYSDHVAWFKPKSAVYLKGGVAF